MIMPSRIQPGELSTALSLSAPVSLFFWTHRNGRLEPGRCPRHSSFRYE